MDFRAYNTRKFVLFFLVLLQRPVILPPRLDMTSVFAPAVRLPAKVHCASGYSGAPTVSCPSTGSNFVISGCILGCGQPNVNQTRLAVSFNQKTLTTGNDYVVNLSLYLSGGVPYSGCVSLLQTDLVGPMALKSQLAAIDMGKRLYTVTISGGLVGDYTLNLAANGQQYTNTWVFVVTQHATPVNMTMSQFYLTATHVGLTTTANFQLKDKYGNNYSTSDPSLTLTTNVSGTSTAMSYVSNGLYRATLTVSQAVGTYTAACFNSATVLKTTSYTVRAGTVSATSPTITDLAATVYLGQTELFLLQLKDAAGNALTQPLASAYSLSYTWTGPGAGCGTSRSRATETTGSYTLTISIAISGQSGTSQVFTNTWSITGHWNVLGAVSMSSSFLYNDTIMSGKVIEFIVTADSVGGGIAYQPCMDVVYTRGQAFGDLYDVYLEGYSGTITYTCLSVNSTGKIVHPYSNQLITGLPVNSIFCPYFVPVSSYASTEQELRLHMFSQTNNTWLIANAVSGSYSQVDRWIDTCCARSHAPITTSVAAQVSIFHNDTVKSEVVQAEATAASVAQSRLEGARLTLQLPPTYTLGKVVVKQFLPPNVAWTSYPIVDHNGTLRGPFTTMPGGLTKNDTAAYGISVLGLGMIADPASNVVTYELSNVVGPVSGNALEIIFFFYVPRLDFYGQNTTSDWLTSIPT
eukprot:g56739.t1